MTQNLKNMFKLGICVKSKFTEAKNDKLIRALVRSTVMPTSVARLPVVQFETRKVVTLKHLYFSLPQVNDLDTILSKAEDLFFKYCRKSTMDCFQLIDEEPAEKIMNWKQRLHLDF